MPKFVIEREIPEAGSFTAQDLQAISEKSCSVLANMRSPIQWVESYVTDAKVYCIYIASDEAAIRAHGEQGDFPANRVSRVLSVIDPTIAESY
jgi:hypothetical protein